MYKTIERLLSKVDLYPTCYLGWKGEICIESNNSQIIEQSYIHLKKIFGVYFIKENIIFKILDQPDISVFFDGNDKLYTFEIIRNHQ
jgi:hypothetical protein